MILFVPFGPRLDRPSAVGDEGRGRSGGLFGATAVAGVALAAMTHLAGLGVPANLAATGAGFTAAGVALFDREEPLVRAGAHLLFLPGLFLGVVGATSGLLSGTPIAGLGAALAAALAAFGGAGAWANAVGDGRVTEATKQGALATVLPLLLVVPLLVLVVAAALLGDALVGVVVPGGGRPALAGLGLLVGVVAGLVRVALGAVPVAALVSPTRRERVTAAVDRWRDRTLWLVLVGVGGWLLVGALSLLGVTGAAYAALPAPFVVLLAVLTGGVVRVPLAVLGVVAFLAAAGAWLVRRVDGAGRRWLGTSGRPLVGAVVLLSVPAPVLVVVATVRLNEPLGLALALGLVALAAVGASVLVGLALLGLAVVPASAVLGLLPDRAGGVALLAAGTLGTAAFVGLAGAPAPVVVGGVAAALVAWDLGSHGVGLTADLGHLPPVRALERRHALRSVAVAGAGAAVALGADAAVGGVAGGTLTTAALAVVGTILLIVPLRG